MKYVVLLLLLLSVVSCNIFNSTVLYNVLFDDYVNNAQICAAWASDQTGPKLTDLYYCKGQLFFACLSALNGSQLSIVGQAPYNDSLTIPINSTDSSSGLRFFKTPTSFGFGNVTVTDCSTASGSDTLCFSVNGTTGEFAVGGYCGAQGYLQAASVELIIFSVPCLYSSVGDSCQIPGVNLCAVNATCDANYLCNGTAVTLTPPVLPTDACYTNNQCDPITGNFIDVTSIAFTPCSTGNPCLTNEICDGNRSCISGFLNCNQSANVCEWNPYCNATTNFTCQYLPRDGAPCTFNGGFACRNPDTCLNRVCQQGSPRSPPVVNFGCVYANQTCNNATGNFDSWFKPNGTACNGTDLCKVGQCAAGGCINFVSLNSTLGPISNCLLPACNSTTGAWYTVSANNAGAACIYPNLTNPNVCAYGVCDGDITCLLLADFFTCPINTSNPCFNYTCDPTQSFANRCNNPIPINDNSTCDVDSCNINGKCSGGACINTVPNNCTTNIPNFDPQCMTFQCALNGGCMPLYYNDTVACTKSYFVPGTAFCQAGACFGTYISTSSAAHALLPHALLKDVAELFL
jgi:hypothetical protein